MTAVKWISVGLILAGSIDAAIEGDLAGAVMYFGLSMMAASFALGGHK